MITLRSIYLENFRNYERAYFAFDPQFNLLHGLNAQGKTNVLEALHYAMIGRSFRTSRSVELVKDREQAFFIELAFTKHQVDQTIRISFDGQERRILYNHTPLSTASGLLGVIPFVITSPDDVNLIKGSPILRRQFLDLQISQTDPLYVRHLMRYVRAMKQRNQLLKAKQALSIESWEYEMSQSAAYIVEQRYRTVNDLQKHYIDAIKTFSQYSDPLQINYKSSAHETLDLDQLQHYYLDQFKKSRPREMFIGHTLVGPHKDDLLFTIEGKEVRFFASEGQQRSCMTTLCLAEWHRLNQVSGDRPVMMVDDVGLGLDMTRREELIQQLSSLGQVFLTSTDEHLLKNSTAQKKCFHVQKKLPNNEYEFHLATLNSIS